jgi:hypothetical protein
MQRCPNCGTIFSDYEAQEGKCPNCGEPIGPNVYEQPSQQKEEDVEYYKKDLSISDSFSKAFDILTDNLGPIIGYWIIPIIFVIIIQIFSNWVSLGMEELDPTNISALMNQVLAVVTITVPLGIVSWLLQVLFAGGLIGMAKEAYETGSTNVDTGLRMIKKYPLGLIGASILLTIIVSLGLFLCLIPGLIFCYWWLFTIPILVIEGRSITNAMSSSKKFSKANETLGFTIVLLLVIFVLSLLSGGIYSIFQMMFTISVGSVPAEVIVGPIISGLIYIFITSFIVITITVHYLKGRPMTAKEYKYQQGNKPPAPPIR